MKYTCTGGLGRMYCSCERDWLGEIESQIISTEESRKGTSEEWMENFHDGKPCRRYSLQIVLFI